MFDELAEARIGRTVGKYEIERIVGTGGMATVYAARHRNGLPVALKVLKPSLAILADVRERFLREGYAANRIEHPGAVRVLDDHETSDGLALLVMELLEGWTIASLAKQQGGRLDVRRVLEIGVQLLDVLAAAHEAGVIHRDVKPENVFLESTGRVKILDFGVARIESAGASTTATGRMLGTPAFMPPEQAYGHRREIDARSDVWSAGATLFSLLAGRPVHVGTTAEETLILAATEDAPRLGTVVAGVPTTLSSTIDRALARAKEERWASAADMRAALRAAYETEFGAAVPDLVDVSAFGEVIRTPRELQRPMRRVPVLVGALFAAVALAAVAVAARVADARVVSRAARVSASQAASALSVEGPMLADTHAQTPAPNAPLKTALRGPPVPEVPAAVPAPEPSDARLVTATGPEFAYELDEEGRKWPKRRR